MLRTLFKNNLIENENTTITMVEKRLFIIIYYIWFIYDNIVLIM